MRSVECLLVLGVVCVLYVTGCLSASLTHGSVKSDSSHIRVRRQLGSSWNMIRPWEARVPCEYRKCWIHDDCCRGFYCFGMDNNWMTNRGSSECRPLYLPPSLS